MNIKPGLFAIATAALVAGASGCAAPASTSGSGAPSPTSATSSTSATGTPSHTSSHSTAARATPTSRGTAQAASPSAAQPVLITIKNFEFTNPKPVAGGAKVMVTNLDPEAHTVTSKRGSFDVKVDGGGGKATFKAPTKPGRYPFICTFHAGMTGTLVVT